MLLLSCAWARADEGLARCVAGLDLGHANALLTRVERPLHAAQRGARLWFFSWISLMVASTAGSLGLAFSPGVERDVREGYLSSAASSALSLVLLLAPPLPTIAVARRIGGRAEPTKRRLTRALALIREAAEHERLLRSSAAQLLNVGVGLTQGLYLGLRHDNGAAVAVPNALGSFVVGELQILSSPRAASELEHALVEERAACVVRSEPAPAVSLSWLISPQGLGARLRF